MSVRISKTIFASKRSRLGRFPSLQRWARRLYLQRYAWAIALDDDMVLCRVLGRIKFYADARDRSISPHLMMTGYWEPRTTEVLMDILQPGMVVVDAGANLGYFTLLMAAQCGAEGHVLAFEPNPRMGHRLEASVMLNGLTRRVTFHQHVLGARDGDEVNLLILDDHPGGTHVTSLSPEGRDFLKLETKRLDGFTGALEATLVKIDAEGSEEKIWQGMTAMIAGPKLRYVIMEFTPASYNDSAGLLDQVEAAGFRVSQIDEQRGIRPISRAEILDGSPQRMLFFER